MDNIDKIQRIVDLVMDLLGISIALLIPIVLYVTYRNINNNRKKNYDEFLERRKRRIQKN